MRARIIGVLTLALLGAAASGPASSQSTAPTPAPSTPTPSTPGPNPGDAAKDAVTNPSRPPAEIAPGSGGAGTPAGGTPAPATPAPATPTRPDGRQGSMGSDKSDRLGLPSPVVAAAAQDEMAPRSGMSNSEMRDLLEAARATAKATREAVDYGRVVPDILTQVLAKLDKIENKLDKVENAVKAQTSGRRR